MQEKFESKNLSNAQMSCITDFLVPPTKITRLWTSTTTHPTTHPTTTGGMFESFAYFNFFFTPVDR